MTEIRWFVVVASWQHAAYTSTANGQRVNNKHRQYSITKTKKRILMAKVHRNKGNWLALLYLLLLGWVLAVFVHSNVYTLNQTLVSSGNRESLYRESRVHAWTTRSFEAVRLKESIEPIRKKNVFELLPFDWIRLESWIMRVTGWSERFLILLDSKRIIV